MGEDGRRLVGYRVKLDAVGRVRYGANTVCGSTDERSEARLFEKRSEAYADIEESNEVWQNGARVVAVYRRRKAGAQ